VQEQLEMQDVLHLKNDIMYAMENKLWCEAQQTPPLLPPSE